MCSETRFTREHGTYTHRFDPLLHRQGVLRAFESPSSAHLDDRISILRFLPFLLFSIDHGSSPPPTRALAAIKNMKEEEKGTATDIEFWDTGFFASLSDGKEVELLPGGARPCAQHSDHAILTWRARCISDSGPGIAIEALPGVIGPFENGQCDFTPSQKTPM